MPGATAGVRRPWLGALVRDAGAGLPSLVRRRVRRLPRLLDRLVPRPATTRYYRYWATDNPGPPLVPDALCSLWHYHHEA